MKKFTINSAEIFDHEIEHGIEKEVDNYHLSGVEVHVEVTIEKINYFIVFQTSETWDIGAISSILKAYDGDEGYLEMQDYINDYEELNDLLEAIKKASKAEEYWDEYVSKNYIRDESHFGGIDANSEFNRVKRKNTA